MFAKLLKHELKAVSGPLGIASLAAVAAGALAGLIMRIELDISYRNADNAEVMGTILSLLMPFVMLGIVAYGFGGVLYLYIRFYRNKFTDEGYLTFTLPVRGWEIFLSSLVSILLWSVLIAIVTIGSGMLIPLIGLTAPQTIQELKEVFTALGDSLENFQYELTSVLGENYSWLSLLTSLLQPVNSIIVSMSCLTLGSVISKKHKILGSIGMYYLYSMLSNILTSFAYAGVLGSEDVAMVGTVQTVNLVYLTLTSIGGIGLSSWLMEKKLNLP